MPASQTATASQKTKRSRRLDPEAAKKIVARRIQSRVRTLYDRPVDELTPEEIAVMRAAFFQS